MESLDAREIFRAWLGLLRPARLFLVPGEAAAGFLLAGGKASEFVLFAICLAAICVHLFGMIANEVADVDDDSKLRPWRPIPSGAIPISHAMIAMSYMALAALACAAYAGLASFIVCIAMIASLSFYNFNLPFRMKAGPQALAFCRGAGVILGAAAVNRFESLVPVELIAAALVFVFVFGAAAARAKRMAQSPEGAPGRRRFALAAAACGVYAILLASGHVVSGGWFAFNPAACLFLALLASSIFILRATSVCKAFSMQLSPQEAKIQFGELAWSALFMQAAFCAAAGSISWSLGILVAAPLASLAFNKAHWA